MSYTTLNLEVELSKEIQIGFPCPHLVVEEPVPLGGDRRSLDTRAPVSNSNTVRVLVNDSLYVPPSGLYNQATLYSPEGPFRIRPCLGLSGPDANLLTVTTSAGEVTVRLPTGDRVSVTRIVEFLKLKLDGFCLVRVADNKFTLSDPYEAGRGSFVRVGGSASDTLGFSQKMARGKELYPAWNLESREEVFPASTIGRVVIVKARYPKFVSPVRGNPTFKVTYSAMPERCPRCQATYVENDYRFSPSGDLLTIMNENLLQQVCLKAILTVRGSNPFHPGYGSRIMNRIGSKSVRAVAARIREDVVNALNTVQELQGKQKAFQQVTNRERLYRVVAVDVTPGPDPTVFNISVVVTNGSGSPVRTTVTYTAPGAVALAGSNGKSLGKQPTRVILGEL